MATTSAESAICIGSDGHRTESRVSRTSGTSPMTASEHGGERIRMQRHACSMGKRAFRLAASADDPAMRHGAVRTRPKLFGLAGHNAVANPSRARQHQEEAGQIPHHASRASRGDDLLPGKLSRAPLQQRQLTSKNTRSEAICAPSRIRTCGLLLRSNPAVDAVASWNDAGQVRGGAHCCRPSYLVIARRALAARSPPRTRHGSRPRHGFQPAYRPWPIRPCLPPRRQPPRGQPPSTHVGGGPGGFLRDLVPVRMSVHAAHSGSAPCPP